MIWVGFCLASVTILVVMFYARELLSWRKGMHRAFSASSKAYLADERKAERISIVIPVRNESGRWEMLFDDLQKQRHLKEEWEVIFVDDHSEDGGAEAIEKACSTIPHFSCIHLPEGKKGKKRALESGISQASNKRILTLDADCRVGKDLLSELCERLKGAGCDLYLLPVLPHSPSGLKEHLIYYEALALLGVLVGSVQKGSPKLANGAGMLFSRSVFFEEGAYEKHVHIDSGDDIFMLQEWAMKGRAIGVLTAPSLLIRTRYPGGMLEGLDQRIRWSMKAKAFRERSTLWSLGIIGAMDLLLIFNALLAFAIPSHLPVLLFSWGVKGGLDRIFLISPLQRLGERFSWKYFPLALLIHPFQIFMISVLSLFRRPLWKGRMIADH